MIYTDYDPLQEVIVGDCYAPGDIDGFLPKESIKGFNTILEETKEDFEKLVVFLEQGGVKVRRPEVNKYDSELNFSNFTTKLPICPIVPRDQYIVLGKKIIQTYTSYTDRYLDSLNYKKIFLDLFKQGYDWISQPPPMLTDLNEDDLWYISNTTYTHKLPNEILWHTATMFKAGDTIIVNGDGPGSKLGLEWMKRVLPEFKFMENQDTIFRNYGHIDHGFFLIDDETVVHGGIEWVPQPLRSKKLIDVKPYLSKVVTDNYIRDYVASGGKYSQSWLEKYLANWRGYAQEVCFDLNVLVLDSKNVLFGKHLPELFAFLKKHGIECHAIEQRHELYWEGGIHCSTLDIKRKGQSRKII